jgi:nucleoside-diphosphate-sugar epimerase
LKQSISILGIGWLGMPLAKHFIEKGNAVKGSTTSQEKIQELEALGIEAYQINLNNLNDTIAQFLDSDILISAIPFKDVVAFQKFSLEVEKSRVKKVIFISSTSVYEATNQIISEKTLHARTDLAIIEDFFRKNTNFDTTVVRFSGLIGYNRKPGNFFPEGKIIPNPNGFVNMIHQDDCVQIIARIIEKDIWNETFNACADTHPTRREFYTKAVLDIGRSVPEFQPKDDKAFKIVSNQKLKVLLDYTFKYPDVMHIEEE